MKQSISNQIDSISVRMHKRTGYSIRHSVIEARESLKNKYPHDFFIFNSDEWETFVLLIDEACK